MEIENEHEQPDDHGMLTQAAQQVSVLSQSPQQVHVSMVDQQVCLRKREAALCAQSRSSTRRENSPCITEESQNMTQQKDAQQHHIYAAFLTGRRLTIAQLWTKAA